MRLRRKVPAAKAKSRRPIAKSCCHSYRKLSTGSSLAARVAGTDPKIIPTRDETTIATMEERPDIENRYAVKKRNKNDSARQMKKQSNHQMSEMKMATARHKKKI